jgi:hypothetical protein
LVDLDSRTQDRDRSADSCRIRLTKKGAVDRLCTYGRAEHSHAKRPPKGCGGEALMRQPSSRPSAPTNVNNVSAASTTIPVTVAN